MRWSAITVVFAALALAGCTAGPAAEPVRSTAPIEAPETAAMLSPMAGFCLGVSRVVSEVWNADVGYLNHGVTAEQWAVRHARAQALAMDLIETTEGDLRGAAERLKDAVDSAIAPPPDLEPVNYAPVSTVLRQINSGVGGCIENGTEVAIRAEWGG